MKKVLESDNEIHTNLYDRFRPVAPQSLIDQVIKFGSHQNGFAVDVGCGSGQFTHLLAPHYRRLLGVDSSPEQVNKATANSSHPHVEFRVGRAEILAGVADSSVDLVSICQALHYLDIDKFYEEVDRLLRPGGVLAIVGYHFTRPAPSPVSYQLIDYMEEVYEATKPFWSYNREIVDSGYRKMRQPPWQCQRSDHHFYETEATLADWIGYISTWSGFRELKKNDKARAEEVLRDFETKCVDALEHVGALAGKEAIKLKLSTNYWVILSMKIFKQEE